MDKITYEREVYGAMFTSWQFYISMVISIISNSIITIIKTLVFHQLNNKLQKYSFKQQLKNYILHQIEQRDFFSVYVKMLISFLQSLPISQLIHFCVVRESFFQLLFKNFLLYVFILSYYVFSLYTKKQQLQLPFKSSFFITISNYMIFVLVFFAYYFLTQRLLSYRNLTYDIIYLSFEFTQLFKTFFVIWMIRQNQMHVNLSKMYDIPFYENYKTHIIQGLKMLTKPMTIEFGFEQNCFGQNDLRLK